MKTRVFALLIAVLPLVPLVSAHAQEVLVPIDAEGKVKYVDAKLEQRLGLFTEYENFREARLFQVSDTSFVLEISYQPEDRLLKARLPLSLGEAEELRRKVTERIAKEAPRITLDQEGRAKLLAGTLVLSMGYYGWALPVAMDVEDGKSFAAIYMLTSGAGFFVPLAVTRNMRVTDGAATLSLYGGTRGIVHGLFAYGLVASEGAGAREALASGMIGSLAEAIAFFRVADKSNMSAGTAEVICIGGDFGLGWGLGTAHLADFFDDDKERLVFSSILLGSGGGLLAGRFLADKQPYTRGDAYVLRGVGFLGAYIPLAVVDLADPEEDKAYSAAAMAGSLIGLGLGNRLVRGKDFTTGQGSLINLSEIAGGLVGLGVAYLASSDDDDNRELYLLSSALGAAGGFWLSYGMFASDARAYEKSSSWNIRLAPEGWLAWAMHDKFKSAAELSVPLTQVEFRF
jgi:hypothetical protein